MTNAIRTTKGRGRLYESVLETVGDTPVIRINNLGPEGVTIYVKAEFFNPAGSVKDRLALNIIEAAEREGRLSPGQTVTPFDLLHLMLIGSSNEPLGVFADYLGASRFRQLIATKLASIGLRDTRFEGLDEASYESQGVTTPEDLFRLSQYLYHNRRFLLEISNGKVTNGAYGTSGFADVASDNPLYRDPRLVGGKVAPREDGAADFLGVFKIKVHGTERPLFVFLGSSTALEADIESVLTHIGSSF